MKKLFLILISTLLFTTSAAAQDMLDQLPEVEGGMAVLIKNIVYPETAKKAGIEGKVFIKVVIDADGNVIETEVVKSATKELDAAAIDAIKKTKFTPGSKDGKKVKSEVTIPVVFKLDGCKDKKPDAKK